MQKYIRNSLLLGAVLMSQSAWAEISSSKAQQLLDASDVELSQQAMQKTLFDDLGGEVAGNLSDAKKAKAKKILVDEFAKANIIKNMKTRVQKELNDAEADYVLSFLKSDLGKKITSIENEMESQNSEDAAKFGRKLMQDQTTSAFAKEVNALTGAGEVVASLLEPLFEMIVASKLEQFGADPDNKAISEMFYNEMIKEAKPMVIAEIENTLAYVYRDLSSTEKKAYLGFLRDDRAQKYIKITMEESSKGTEKVFRAWLKQLPNLA